MTQSFNSKPGIELVSPKRELKTENQNGATNTLAPNYQTTTLNWGNSDFN